MVKLICALRTKTLCTRNDPTNLQLVQSHDIAKDTPPLLMEYPNSSDHNRGYIIVIMTENHEEGGGILSDIVG